MTLVLLLSFLAVQAAFVWGRYAVFRIAGRTPNGVRLIEVASVISILVGSALIAQRSGGKWATDLMALAMAVAAAMLFGWGAHTVGRMTLNAAFTPQAPSDATRLITDGPFAWLRHPFYAAYLLGHAVPLLATRSVWALPPWLLLLAIYTHAARSEERRFAAGPLALAWRAYAGRTGVFGPRRSRKPRAPATTGDLK